MKIQLTWVFLLLASILLGQSFEFEYSTPDDDRLWDVFETEDGNFYCVGHVAKPGSNKYKGLILKIDTDGQLVSTHIIDIPNRSYDIYGILQDTAGALVLCGKTSDTTESMYHTRLEFNRINYNVEVIDSGTIVVEKDKKVGGLGKNIGFNNEFLITGGLISDINPPVENFLLRLNQSLDSLVMKVANLGFGFHIKQLNSNIVWQVGTFGYSIYDNLFNYIDHHDIPHSVHQPHGVKWDTDTSFFLVGEWDAGPDNDIGIIRQFHPLDTTGHLYQTWGTDGFWDFPAGNGAVDFHNKDSVFVGIISPFWPWMHYPSHYVVLQTDSLLNIRWERFYGDGEYYYELMKVLATKDGGCLLAGTRYEYNAGVKERDIYLVKLNSEGLIVGESENPEITMQEALVFPNPGKNEMNVRIAAQYPTSSVSLYDVNGSLVLEQDIHGKWGTINTAFLIPGTYIYRITSGDGLFETGKWLKQ